MSEPSIAGAAIAGTRPAEGSLAPIFVSVKEAARALSISPWVCYQLLDQKKLEGRYVGRRRLVKVDSIHAFANSLSEYPEKSA